MIYVTQGHEKGIGLEVFIKSFLTLSLRDQSHFTLIANLTTLTDQLNSLKLKYSINNDVLTIQNQTLSLQLIHNNQKPQSTESLELALSKIQDKKDILITLPTSKDQLIYNNKNCLGYTEYLRDYFQKLELAMFFYSEQLKVLLLTDHVQLNHITSLLSEDLIIKKVDATLRQFPFSDLYFSGINPHAGENGLLGNEDKVIADSLKELQIKYPKIKFHGPFSGDVLHYKINPRENQLLVYCFHDQGLILFKSQQSLMGINITLGLPFLRLSVDHGTGFDLYGKNQANYLGCFYTLKKALEWKHK